MGPPIRIAAILIHTRFLGAAFLALLAGCAPSEEESEYLAQRALLLRQNRGISEMIAEANQGSMIPRDRFLIGIGEAIVGDLLRAQLPFERPLGKHFVVKLEHATVSLRDKFGAITLDGELYRPAKPDRKTAVRVYGGLGAVSIDSTSDLLSIRIAIDHFELVRAGVLEGVIGRGGKKFLAERGQKMLEDALPHLQVPVALGQRIRIPAIQEEGVRLDSLVVPLHLSVERVIAARGKLWVTLDADVGEVIGAEEGLGVVVEKKRSGGKP